MTTLEWIVVIGVAIVVVEITITLLSMACRAVFDLESVEKLTDNNQHKQAPTFITGKGRLDK